MFLHNFVMKGLLASIGQMPDYWVITSALNWYDKGVLVEQDLEQINAKIEELHPVIVEEQVEENEVEE